MGQEMLGEVPNHVWFNKYFYYFDSVLQNSFVEYISKCLDLMSKTSTSLWCLSFSSTEKFSEEESSFSEAVIFVRPEIFKMSYK